LHDRLRALASARPNAVVEVRGAGLIAGLELSSDAAPVIAAALDRGLLVNRTATTVVRLLPPYIAGESHVDEMAGILEEILQ
jgi:acetylornithine/succinyldiaminopimelate/putrescine aminotransferase